MSNPDVARQVTETALELTGKLKEVLLLDLNQYLQLCRQPQLTEEEKARLAELSKRLKIYSLESAIERMVRLELDLIGGKDAAPADFNYTVTFNGDPTD